MPDKNHVWLNQTDNDFEKLVPIISDDGRSIFNEISTGCSTGRDEWVHDFDKNKLVEKIKYFINFYTESVNHYKNNELQITNEWGKLKINSMIKNDGYYFKIKQTYDLLKYLKNKITIGFFKDNIKQSIYRPFVQKYLYYDNHIIERTGKFDRIFINMKENKLILFLNPDLTKQFSSFASNIITDCHCVGDTQCIPFYIDDKSNITKYAMRLFQRHYKNNKISHLDVFYYVYAILNDPKYEKTYKYNLERKHPRIPLAENFESWSKIGEELFDLHVEFDKQEQYPLKTVIQKLKNNKVKLQLKQNDKSENDYKILIDENTTLEGIPEKVIQYKIGSKCALEWILEFYKEGKNQISERSSNDPKIREKFNTYNFADHKDHVISLLKKITTVSLKTINLREKLEKMEWGLQPDLGFKTEIKTEIKKIKPKIKKIKKKKTTDKIQKLDLAI